MTTALATTSDPPADVLVGAIGVTQDGWIRFTSEAPDGTRNAEGKLVPTDVYKLHLPRNYRWGRNPACDFRIEKHVAGGETYFVRHVRESSGEWSKPEEYKTLGSAKGEDRLHAHDGKKMQHQLEETWRRQYAESVGVDFYEYRRRYQTLCARENMWRWASRSKAAVGALRKAKLDNKSIKAQRARVLREGGLDDGSIRDRRQAVLEERGLGYDKGWPRAVVNAWLERARSFRGAFLTKRPWDPERIDAYAREAACQEFPELWS